MESYSYKQSIANTMDRRQSFEDQNNDDSQSMSGHAKRDQFSKFEPKFDIMNIVMKRRVGGSSEEDSPLKKRKTENSIDSERSQCITGTRANENGKSNVAVDTAGGPDKHETRIAGDVNVKQRFDTDPQCNSHDTNHSKAFRGLESKENKLNRSEDDLVERSDNIEHEHISSMNRSELLSTSFEKAFGTESPDRNHTLNHTLSKHFATNEDKDNPDKCNNNPAKCINNPDKCNKSSTSEIRLKIPPTVYRNHTHSGDSKKQGIDDIRKADEGGGEESGTDETDGDATSNANTGFGGEFSIPNELSPTIYLANKLS